MTSELLKKKPPENKRNTDERRELINKREKWKVQTKHFIQIKRVVFYTQMERWQVYETIHVVRMLEMLCAFSDFEF